MEKLNIFEITLPNGVDTALGVVIDVVSIEGDKFDTKTKYLIYCQNRLAYCIEHKVCVGTDYDTTYYFDNTVIDYVVLPEYDECLANWREQQKLNHRMILIESALGLSVEQEIAICEAIKGIVEIVSPEENHLHVAFDRDFADKELVDKYNLVYTTIDE